MRLDMRAGTAQVQELARANGIDCSWLTRARWPAATEQTGALCTAFGTSKAPAVTRVTGGQEVSCIRAICKIYGDRGYHMRCDAERGAF